MSVSAGTVAMHFIAQIDQATAAMAEVRRQAEVTAVSMTNSGKKAGFFKELNSALGKKSDLGQALKLIAGGGAIAAVGMAAKTIEHMTETIAELANTARDGGVHVAELTSKFVEEIPVVGRLWKSIQNLHEAFTGMGHSMKKFQEDRKYQEDYAKDIQEISDSLVERTALEKTLIELENKRNEIMARPASLNMMSAQRNLDRTNAAIEYVKKRLAAELQARRDDSTKKEHEKTTAAIVEAEKTRQDKINAIVEDALHKRNVAGKSDREVMLKTLRNLGATDLEVGMSRSFNTQAKWITLWSNIRKEIAGAASQAGIFTNNTIQSIKQAGSVLVDWFHNAGSEQRDDLIERARNLIPVFQNAAKVLSPAVAGGSVDAVSAINRASASARIPFDSIAKDALEAARGQLKEEQKQTKLLMQLLDRGSKHEGHLN